MKRILAVFGAIAVIASAWGLCLAWAQDPRPSPRPQIEYAPLRAQIVPNPAYGAAPFVPQYSLVLSQEDGERQRKIAGAVVQLRDTKDETAKAEKSKELLALLGEDFDARQKAREEELKALEGRLKQLREFHSKRQSEKEAIVKDRARQLLRESDGLGWGDASTAPGPFNNVTLMRAPGVSGTGPGTIQIIERPPTFGEPDGAYNQDDPNEAQPSRR